MELLFVLGLVALGLWSWAQARHIEALSRRIEELERRASAAADEPLLLDQPLAPDELLLDTPIPEPVNDAVAFPAESPSRLGQAIAVAALLAAFSMPAFAFSTWPWAAVAAFVCGVGAGVFLAAALKRWAWLAMAALVGLHAWFALAIASDAVWAALAFVGAASICAASLPLLRSTAEPQLWRYVRVLGPGVAVSVGAVLLLWAWLLIAPQPPGLVEGPALLSVGHVVLAALLVRNRAAAGAALAVSISALVVAFAAYQGAHARFGPPGETYYPTILIAALIVVIAALGARPHRSERNLTAGVGAAGAAILVALAALSRPEWNSPWAWTALFAGAAVLFAAALTCATKGRQHAADYWAVGAAVLALIGCESLVPPDLKVAGLAAAALAFAAAFAAIGWRMLALAALSAAALSVAHALTPATTELTWSAVLVLALGAALLLAASHVAGQRFGAPLTRDILSTTAMLIVVVGCLSALRGAHLEIFTEAALRALILLVAGHAIARFGGASFVGRWRAHLLLAAGLVYACALPGLELNPWWGASPAAITGPPVLNALSLAFLAPAALGFAAAQRFSRDPASPMLFYAAASGVLVLLWVALEVRRGFHGGAMAEAPVGVLEGATYALLALAAACALAFAARRTRSSGQRLQALARLGAWAGILLAAFILLVSHHPWWGAQQATDSWTAGAAVLAQLAACALSLALGRALSTTRGPEPTRFAAAAAAAVFGWSFGHTAIRWLHHGAGMHDALAGLEGFAHAVWPLAFASLAAFITAHAPGRDTVRSYLFDLQAIWAAAMWPVSVFAALGLWLVFNPWWGLAPVRISGPVDAILALSAFVMAAVLSAAAPATPHVRWRQGLTRAANMLWSGHLLVAGTLAVRWLIHPTEMHAAPITTVEVWLYVAVLLAAAAFWVTGRQRLAPRSAGDLFAVTPAARRERRYGRRQRTP